MNDNSIKRIKLYLGSLLFDGFPTDSVVNDILNYIESEIIPPAIAARDKWWITQMESKFFAAIGCRLFPDNCDSCSIIERCTALGWQRFKSTLEVK